ncbi:S1-C subfamily serine protease [Dysgonomonadaceae bacterium PH5-43]|nr:S1-C subfamily serine protease [Dysgonomonadaceae bacterium PH5-43]
MARPTEKYKRSFAGSVGAGIGALINGSGRTYYILEHKVTTKYHRAGESQKIIVDQIELGRDSSCQIRFDENFGTVSRKHAAIVRDGDNWKLIQLSTTNSTFLNGRPITKEWYLQSGDEIQLSVNGPKMGFIVPQGKQGLTSSIKLTERLNLFRQQSLKPYKRAIVALSIVLVLAIGGLTTWNYMLKDDLKHQSILLADAINIASDNAVLADSLANKLIETNSKIEDYQKQLDGSRKKAAAAWKLAQDAIKQVEKQAETGGIAPGGIKQCYSSVYYIEIRCYSKGILVSGSSGTGFLLNDGRFVTARHVIDTWSELNYKRNDDGEIVILSGMETTLNQLANNDESYYIEFIAVSPVGDKISFRYTPKEHPFTIGNSTVSKGTYIDEHGFPQNFQLANYGNHTDWAYFRPKKSGGLKFDNEISSNLTVQQSVYVLGFPAGLGVESINDITPIYSESKVALEGLTKEGVIMVSNWDFQGGSSGGPVLIYNKGEYHVIGVLSGALGLAQDGSGGKGRIVPISAFR